MRFCSDLLISSVHVSRPEALARGGTFIRAVHMLECALFPVSLLARFMFSSLRSSKSGLRTGLAKSRQGWLGRIRDALVVEQVTDETWEEIEEYLIMGDVGLATAEDLIADTREALRSQRQATPATAFETLKSQIRLRLEVDQPFALEEPRLLTVVFIIGVNGAGKTTTIGKLAYLYRQQGRKVLLAAADTFRAAAVDQLQIWGERAGVEVISHGQGADPGAVVYDAIRASQQSRQADLLLVDTAGRLHTKYNLMQELQKLRTVAGKLVHRAPHEVLLTLDASTGQNAILQANHFTESTGVTGIVMTKLDGSSKGGAVICVKDALGIPVRFVGVGERIEDLLPFDSQNFTDGLLD